MLKEALPYDSSRIPRFASGAAETIARFAPMHLLKQVQLHREKHKDDEYLSTRYEELCMVFGGVLHRCEVALRRLEGESAEVDPAKTGNGKDITGNTLVAARALIMDAIKGSIDLAEGWAKAFREALEPAAGKPLDAVGLELEAEVKEGDFSAERLRHALSVFRV